jgi:hypothetical protein
MSLTVTHGTPHHVEYTIDKAVLNGFPYFGKLDYYIFDLSEFVNS